MDNAYVVIIGFDENITGMRAGDGLFLVFAYHRRICLVRGNWDEAFPNNPLPTEYQQAGTIWPSNGWPAIAASTAAPVEITYTSRDEHSNCPKPGEEIGVGKMPNHTITVGG